MRVQLIAFVSFTLQSWTCAALTLSPSREKIAVFSTSTDRTAYLQQIITGMELMKEVNKDASPEIDYFVAGPIRNASNLELLHSYGIQVLDLDADMFDSHCDERKEHTAWLKKAFTLPMSCLPAESHLWSAVPEKLAPMGYKLSMYLDAADVVAMKPINVQEVKETLKSAGATMAYTPRGSAQVDGNLNGFGDSRGTTFSTSILWFDNAAAVANDFFGQYAAFFAKYKDAETYRSQICQTCKGKVQEKRIEYMGKKGGPQFLQAWEESLDDPPRNIQFAKLEMKWQMQCAHDLSQVHTDYWLKNPPYFVHFQDECHMYINPATVQNGVPSQAKTKWKNKITSLFGKEHSKMQYGTTWFR